MISLPQSARTGEFRQLHRKDKEKKRTTNIQQLISLPAVFSYFAHKPLYTPAGKLSVLRLINK